ncbi:MAG TPA: RNA methyltransferase [Actinotalea sp.]|jgi:TrmH family RNA methyltransferase
MPELTNPRSERVKAVRALAGRSARLRSGRFLVEGPQAVREAVRFRAASVADVYVTQESGDRYPEITRAAAEAGVRVHLASAEVLEAMSDDAQHVLAVAATTRLDLDAALSRSPRLVAVLANVRDPGNAGTVIRAADACGADLVVLAGDSVDVHNPKVVRSTAGSLFHLPVVTGVTVTQAVDGLRSARLGVLAADGSGEHDLDDLLDLAAGPGQVTGGAPDLRRPTAWLFGNEAWGLSEAERDLADAVVRVPIRGLAESLNLATAATVCLYASSRAQRAAG